mgnify:CR=1 FL=1
MQFRAWDRDTQKMLYEDSNVSGDYLWQFNGEGQIVILAEQQVDRMVGCLYHEQKDEWLPIDCDIMLFTGLIDKDGNKIYESDILGGYPHGTAYVEWNSEYGCFESVSENNDYDNEGNGTVIKHGNLLANDLKDCFDNWTVIGNIYENPELLS